MPTPPIHNRTPASPPADGWYQIERSGEHPVSGGRVQVVDDRAVESIVNRFAAWRESLGEHFGGMLVDADHLSHDLSHATEAMGWLMEVANRAGELWGRIELTGLGESALRNRAYKWFSTEYAGEDLEPLGGGRFRPLALGGLALTNRPQIRGGRPIVNRGAAADPTPNPGGSPEGQPNDNNTTTMQAIAEKLGLSAEATEADILSAIDALLAERATTEAEAVLNRYADRVPADKRPAVLADLISNRATTERMLDLLPKPAAAGDGKPIHNRSLAADPPPVGDGGAAADPAVAAAKARAAERDALVLAIRNRSACDFRTAWDIARRQKPELF